MRGTCTVCSLGTNKGATLCYSHDPQRISERQEKSRIASKKYYASEYGQAKYQERLAESRAARAELKLKKERAARQMETVQDRPLPSMLTPIMMRLWFARHATNMLTTSVAIRLLGYQRNRYDPHFKSSSFLGGELLRIKYHKGEYKSSSDDYEYDFKSAIKALKIIDTQIELA